MWQKSLDSVFTMQNPNSVCSVGAALRAFVEENSPTEDASSAERQFSGVETKPRKILLIATSSNIYPLVDQVQILVLYLRNIIIRKCIVCCEN